MYIYNDIEDIDSKNTFFYKPPIHYRKFLLKYLHIDFYSEI